MHDLGGTILDDLKNAVWVPADDEYPPSSIISLLGGGAALAVFSLSCAERLGAVVERLADAASVRSTVRSGLDLGWDALADHPDDEAIARVISDLDEIISTADGNLGRYHGYLDDAISATAYALEVVSGSDEAAALNVVGRCREVAFQLARQLWPRMSLRELMSSYVVREEVLRQVRDAERIAQWGDVRSPDLLADLRQVAQREGATLANIIRNRAGGHGGR